MAQSLAARKARMARLNPQPSNIVDLSQVPPLPKIISPLLPVKKPAVNSVFPLQAHWAMRAASLYKKSQQAAEIIDGVCARLMVGFADACGPSRIKAPTFCRQMIAFLLHQYGGLSYPNIGAITKRSNDAVRHSCRVMRAVFERMETEPPLGWREALEKLIYQDVYPEGLVRGKLLASIARRDARIAEFLKGGFTKKWIVDRLELTQGQWKHSIQRLSLKRALEAKRAAAQ